MLQLDWSIVTQNMPHLVKGLMFSFGLCFSSALVGGVGLGTILAVLRFSRYPWVVRIVTGYVTLMRATPFLMVMFWFYFLLPLIIKNLFGSAYATGIDAFYSAFIAFALFEAAYFSEIIRAGIQAVPGGQRDAARSLGLSQMQCYRLIIFPQAFRKMMPALLTQCIILFQDTAVVYVVGLSDFLGTLKHIAERDGRMVEAYLFAAVVYFLISFSASKGVELLKHK
ncbi:MAG: ABC transporter permease subunit [Pseudomonadota bacterium]